MITTLPFTPETSASLEMPYHEFRFQCRRSRFFISRSLSTIDYFHTIFLPLHLINCEMGYTQQPLGYQQCHAPSTDEEGKEEAFVVISFSFDE